MQDGTISNGSKHSLFHRSNEIVRMIKEISPVPVHIYSGTVGLQEHMASIPPENGIFNIQTVLDECMNTESQANIIITDGVQLSIPVHYNGNTPVYLVNPEIQPDDIYLKSVHFENNGYITHIVNRSVNTSAVLTVQSTGKELYRNRITLKPNLNTFFVQIPALPEGNIPALQFRISASQNEINMLNNEFYVVNRSAIKKIPVHIFMSSPSFDSRFLIRFLQQSGNYQVTTHFPLEGKPLIIPANIPREAIVFLMDIDGAKTIGLENINRFLTQGGCVHFHYRNTAIGNNRELKKLLPFDYSFIQQNENTRAHFSITPQGMEYPFIHFRDKSNAETIWKKFSGLSVPGIRVIPNQNLQTLLLYGGAPAIMLQKRGAGKLIVTLPYPLWKMDFPSHGYGTETHYLNVFYQDIINEFTRTPSKPFQVNSSVIFSGDTLQINVHPSFSEAVLKRTKKMIMRGKNFARELYFERSSGDTFAKIALHTPGKYTISLSGERFTESIFVNYPRGELSDGNADTTLKKIASQNKHVHFIGLSELNARIKKMKPIQIFKQGTKRLPLFAYLISGVFLLLILFLLWFVRMRTD